MPNGGGRSKTGGIKAVTRTRLLALLAPLVLILSACGINSVPAAEEQAKAAWANVEAAQQRRLDVLPSLARVATAASGHERELQIGVAEARTVGRVQLSGEQLSDPAAMQRYAAAQAQVGMIIGRIVQEVPPENRAQQNFSDVIEAIEQANNRINIAIRDYNEAVRQYNTLIRTFPSVIGARVVHGARPLVPYQSQPGADRAPDLDFGNLQK
jgi:LemA protein